MTDSERLAQRYFSSPIKASFWRWAEGCQVAAWTDGTTLAFRQEIEEVLCRLAPQGLPPFDAVLLVIAACREDWPERRQTRFAEIDSLVAATDAVSWERWVVILSGLDAVHALSPRHRLTPRGKALLAETIFEPAQKCHSPEEARLILKGLAEGIVPLEPEPLLDGTGFYSPSFVRFIDAIDALSEGLAGADITEAAISLREQTGLDRLPTAAGVEVPACERVRLLLKELLADKELSGLARLTYDLMASVYIPRTVSDIDDLPAGGVADITNRGPLDRLLVSELAHDDLTLAARVAIGEALYLRRERPPRRPAAERTVLIDAGIRLWGVPRVLATAVAMAMAATAGPQMPVRAFRAKDADVDPVDITTREGLVAHLAALEPASDPASALDPFLEACEGADRAGERVLITHEDVLSDPDFRPALALLGEQSFYVATVTSDGTYRLRRFSPMGHTNLGEARLNLDHLAASSKEAPPPVPLVRCDVDPNLPVFLGIEPSPLFVPPIAPSSVLCCEDSERHGSVLLTKDGRLLCRAAGAKTGLRELTCVLPRGKVMGLAIDDQGIARAVIPGKVGRLSSLLTVDLATGRWRTSFLEAFDHQPLGVCWLPTAIAVMLPNRVDVLALTTGERILSHLLPARMQWRSGRFFQQKNDWYAMTFDGAALGLEKVGHGFRIRLLFDRTGLDGPWAVGRREARVFSLVDGSKAPHAWDSCECQQAALESRDGHLLRLVLLHAEKHMPMPPVVVDLRTGKTAVTEAVRIMGRVTSDTFAWSWLVSLRRSINKLEAVCVDEAGAPAIVCRGNRVMRLVLDGDRIYVRAPSAELTSQFARRPLQPVRGPAGALYHMRVATWDDGSRAYVDSRGFLHLKSSDAAVPEVTLFLVESGSTAGWASSGQFFGPPFIIGDQPPVSGEAFFENIRQFAMRLR